MTRINQIVQIEFFLGIKFLRSYRQFLLEKGSAAIAGYPIFGLPEQEKEEEQGKLLSFRAGNPRKGSFYWIAQHKEKIVGLCMKSGCGICNLNKREKLKGFKGGKIKVELSSHQRTHKEFYIGHLISIPEKETKREELKISVLEATLILRYKRPDISKKLVVISSKKDLRDGKEKALCIDLEKIQGDDAALVEVSDINQEGTPIYHHSKSFIDWLEHLKRLVERDKQLQINHLKIKNRKSEIRWRVIGKELKQRYKDRCPLCKRPKGHFLICRECFNNWRKENGIKVGLIEWIQDRLEVKLPKFTHRGGKKVRRIHLRPQDWHTRILRVRDYATGLAAFRFNQRLDYLEIDAFWSGDLPGYVKGQALRNLTTAILSEAYYLTGSLNIAFTKDVREGEASGRFQMKDWREAISDLPDDVRKEAERSKGRISRPIPQELANLVSHYNVILSQTEQGKIHHQEGLQLFWAMLEWPQHLQDKVNELEEKKYLTKDALAKVIYSGIWSKEEVIWLFENAPRPEAVVLGSDLPEDRLFYTESMYYGRAAFLASLLKTKISVDLARGQSVEERENEDCILESRGRFWTLKAKKDFQLPWTIKGSEPVTVKSNESMLLISVPCQTTKFDEDKEFIRKNIEYLKNANSESKIRCLLVSFEFSDFKHGMKVSEEIKEISKELADDGIYLLFSSYKLDVLSGEVETKMDRIRKRRQFPSRPGSIKIQVIKIPKDRWEKSDMVYSVEDAQNAASWIRKKISQKLGRIRFRANCGCIERIAVQDPDCKKIAELNQEDSKNLLVTLKDKDGITFPFVTPQAMPEFLKRVNVKVREALQNIKGGIVVIVPPFARPLLEPEMKTHNIQVPSLIRSNFQCPIDPYNINLSSYTIKRKEEIVRIHQQIQETLRPGGHPFAASYIRHELFPEVLRDYIYYNLEAESKEKSFLFFFKYRKKSEKRNPDKPVNLRIVYSDGTEGQPFPLFCLLDQKRFPRPTNLYKFKIGSISMRHVSLDLVTEGYLIQNLMIKRKETSAEQEDYAYRKTWYFLSNFIDLIQHKRIDQITQEIRFRYLWDLINIKEKKYNGCELHIYQTGLEPSVIGIYRAVIKFLREHRGELVVVPRLIGRREKKELRKKEQNQESADAAYLKAAEWF